MKYEVIPAQLYRRDDGKTASPYGAVPWTSEAEKERWTLEQCGWTVRNPHTGIIGVGRQPWGTKSGAEEFAETHAPPRSSPGD